MNEKSAILRMATAALVAVALLMAVPARAVEQAKAAAEQKYLIGLRLGYGQEQDARIKSIGLDFLNIMAASLNMSFEPRWFLTDKDLLDALKTEKPDMISTFSSDLVETLIRDHGYQAFMKINLFGLDKFPTCLYVGADSKHKKIADLEQARAVTYPGEIAYFQLYDLLGKNPSEFFWTLKMSPNAISSIYAVAMGDTDAAFVDAANIEHLKVMNPGPLKKVRSIGCSKEGTFAPMMVSKTFPQTAKDAIRKKIANFGKDADFKTYWPLAKQLKARFVPASNEDYKMMFDLADMAAKKGWDKDYRKWRAMAK